MTDRQTDGRPGKNNMSPDPKGGGGGRHNFKLKWSIVLKHTGNKSEKLF